MDTSLAREAINAALNKEWEEAIKINLSILKVDTSNVEALNRLARAYAESGDIKKAKTISKKVLKIDPGNVIANKCFEKWNNFKKATTSSHTSKGFAKIFIEEGGKTKIINLINLGDSSNITALDCGDQVNLVAHAHRVSIKTTDDKYIGRFPDNLAIKFINLIKLGTHFEAVIKSASKEEVKVLVHSF